MIEPLLHYLAAIPPGPIPDPGGLERLLAACWHEFRGDDGGMTGQKLLGRMEDRAWGDGCEVMEQRLNHMPSPSTPALSSVGSSPTDTTIW